MFVRRLTSPGWVRYWLLLLAIPFAYPVHAQDEKSAGYDYLNALRVRADMIPFTRNLQLETAAGNHSNYLIVNSSKTLRVSGHFENPGDPGFTGNSVSDRTAAAGFLSKLVGENVSNGQDDVFKSIDDLMSAIYHRFGFLSFSHNLMGLGFVKNPDINYTAYTYNSGNSGLNSLCQGASFSGFGTFSTNVCAQNSSFRISLPDKTAAENAIIGQNPMIVRWPQQGDIDVPPAFFEESPDPLPDFSVSGYPISLQFNPMSFSSVSVKSFRLFDDVTGTEITNTRLLDQKTDPNAKFSSLEYALFPLQRLDWKSVYRVEVNYDSNKGPGSLLWKFATRNPGAPIFQYAGNGAVVNIPSNVTSFFFYVPPEPGFPTIGAISTQFPANLSLTTNFLDSNTLSITMQGSAGQQASFFLAGRSFILRIGNPAVIPPDPVLNVSVTNSSPSPTQATTASYDIGTQILTLPLVVIDGGDRVGMRLRLSSQNDLTFAFDGVIAADNSVKDAATFTSSSLVLNVPRLQVAGTFYSLQMQLIDLNKVVLRVTDAQTISP